jgi:hypothetical protein
MPPKLLHPLFPQMPKGHAPGCSSMILYTRHIAANWRELEAINSAKHPTRRKILEKLDSMSANELHWDVASDASKKALPRMTQRSTLKMRWRHAFQKALLKRGYATNGEDLKTNPPQPGLTGRLEILLTNGQGFEDSKDHLIQQCCAIIRFLEGQKQKRRPKWP